MNPATAIGFILLALEAHRLYAVNNISFINRACWLATFVVIIASAMKLSDLMFGTSFHIDQQLFSSKLALEIDHPSRMAPNTTFCFFVLGCSMLFLRNQSDFSIRVAQVLAVIPAFIALMAIIGYIYGVKPFYGIGIFIPMAINTAASFLFLAGAVIFARPNKGYLRVLTTAGYSGSIASILLPAVIFVPILLGWIALAGERLGFYNIAFAVALSVILNIVVLFLLTYISVRRLFLSNRHKQAVETELRESEERYRSLVENSPMCIHELDMDGRLSSMNKAGVLMMGAKDENAVLGYLYLDAVDASDRENIGELLTKAYAGEISHFEFKVSGPSGQIFKSCFVPIMNSEGVVTKLMGITEDITERMLAENDLRIAATAFESQEGMLVTDANGVILRVNRTYVNVTGYTAEEVIGRNPRIFSSGRKNADFYVQMWESINNTGTWEGEIWNRRKNGEIYPAYLIITAVKDKDGIVTNYVGTFNDITVSKAAADEIKHLAFYDPLTQLPNRRLLRDRLQQAMAACARSGMYGALLFIDLDNFKTLNDTFGHDKGDLLLQQVAGRLAGCVRECDTVARLGGDEFVIMLEDLSQNSQEAVAQSETVGEKILATLNQPYQLASYEHHSTPSIGVTLFSDHVRSIDELLKQADIAMYQAKAAGRNTQRFFEPSMQTEVTTRTNLEADLNRGLQEKQFLLHYQPQMNDDGQIIGAEALVRWQHPQRGLMHPVEFTRLAEETGQIVPLSLWVLETACAQLRRWAEQRETAHLTLAVNVGARQFHQVDFVDQVLAVLDHTGADPRKLKLGLTESLLVSNVEDTIVKMTALKAKGVSFSLDDFGTGYSSLSYLKQLPLDQLKIDQGFIRDILIDSNDAAIAKMVVALAENMGLAVIAEGVEDEAQRDFLAHHGCHAYQGYLVSRPLPLAAFEEFLKRV